MRKLYNMIALVMISGFMFAQGSVSGTVTDGAGNALFGANVTVEGTSSGAASLFAFCSSNSFSSSNALRLCALTSWAKPVATYENR